MNPRLRDRVREDTRTLTPGKGRTHQSFKEESDVNTIMGHYRKTGSFGNVQLHTPVYGDFTNAEDYMEAANALRDADAIFASLPARVRARVENNPAAFMAFVADPQNAAELEALGLANPVSPDPAPTQPAPAQESPETAESAADPSETGV